MAGIKPKPFQWVRYQRKLVQIAGTTVLAWWNTGNTDKSEWR